MVITGGSSHLDNIIQLAVAILGQKVRLAAPQGAITADSVEDASDVYAATAVGLVLETLDPKLSHAVEFKKESPVQPAKPADNGLFEDEPEEEEQLSAREERERRREEERKAKELRKQQEAQRKQEEKARKAQEKAEKKKQPSFFDMFFSDSDKDNA